MESTLWKCSCGVFRVLFLHKSPLFCTTSNPLSLKHSIQRQVLPGWSPTPGSPLNHWLSPRPPLIQNFSAATVAVGILNRYHEMKPSKKWQAYLPKHLDTDVDQDMFTTKPRLGGRVWSKATTVGKLATKPNTATFHYWRRQPARHMYAQVSTNFQLKL